MMVEVGLVVGYLVAWAVSKARRAAKRLDNTVDTALDSALDHLDQIVRSKLGLHSALTDLDQDVQSKDVTSSKLDLKSATAGVPNATRQQLELALSRAISKDRAFNKKLSESLAQLQKLDPETAAAPRTLTLNATVSGINTRSYQAGNDIHIKDR